MKMPFINLTRQYQLHKEVFDRAIYAVLEHGQYVHGSEVTEFETQLRHFTNAKHAITCGNGTDALILALKAMHLQKNDVVFVPSLTFAATAEAVVLCGGIPFFVDIDENTYNLNPESLKTAVLEAEKQSLKAVGIIAVNDTSTSAVNTLRTAAAIKSDNRGSTSQGFKVYKGSGVRIVTMDNHLFGLFF